MCLSHWTEREVPSSPCEAALPSRQVYTAVDLEEAGDEGYVWKKPACGVQ